MRIRQLEYFIAAAEELHFGKAAKRMHIEQPPLSRQIKALEEELGAKLLNRTNRKVSLTEEGKFFLDEARHIVDRLRNAEAAVRGMAAGEEGTLHVGFVSSMPSVTFASMVRDFRERHPRIRLSIWGGCTTSLLGSLENNCVHAAFVRPMGRDMSGCRMLPFSRESYDIMLPDSHPLAEQETVHISQLKDEPIILFPRQDDQWVYDALIAGFQKAGFCPNIVQETDSDTATKSFVAAGIGMAPSSPSARLEQHAGIAYRPVEGCMPPIEVFLAWPEHNPNPMVEKFVEHARDYALI